MRLWHRRGDEATSDDAPTKVKREWPTGGAAGMMGMTTDPESFPGHPLLGAHMNDVHTDAQDEDGSNGSDRRA